MKMIIIPILMLCMLPIVLAIETSTSSYDINYFHSSASDTETTVSDVNISFGGSQFVVGNYTASDINPQVGLFYIENITKADTTGPSVTVYSPTATTYTTENITINFTATDDFTLAELWYYNTSDNVSYTDGTAPSINLTDDTYTFTFYANDTSGNVGSTDVTFTIQTVAAFVLDIADYGIEWISLNWT